MSTDYFAHRDDPNVQLPEVEPDRRKPSVTFLQGRVVELRRCVDELDKRVVKILDVIPLEGISHEMWSVKEALKQVEREVHESKVKK